MKKILFTIIFIVFLSCTKDENIDDTACYMCNYTIVTVIQGSAPTNKVITAIYCDMTEEQINQKIKDADNRDYSVVNGKQRSVTTWMKCTKSN